QLFHNYDVSFHNELWSSAFSGNFATGLTWHWARVFWWPDALPTPPQDVNNQYQGAVSNASGATNHLKVNGLDIPVVNRTIYHNFKPLAGLLNDSDWQSYGLLNSDYSPRKVYDGTNEIECYYLMSEDQTAAIGWVHNLNAWVMNSYYLATGLLNQNFLGCTAPNTQSIALPGFLPDMDYHITWFPTRMNMSELPDDQVDDTGTGTVTLDMSSEPLGGVANNYLDTLHADYAFIIAPQPIQKMAEADGIGNPVGSDSAGSFGMYPNPAANTVTLLLPADGGAKDIALYDLAGKRVVFLAQVTDPLVQLPTGHLGRGIYCVRVFDGVMSKAKTLILR
ncbi:MAG TPA: T9SS type A sorting domain-containing protein, partial [Flavobacteriales bacterium]|nr:T9SS type A sorting domain-containing protein [Flavobacteriales bacterium]